MRDEILSELDVEINKVKTRIAADVKELEGLKAKRKARKDELVAARDKALAEAKAKKPAEAPAA